MQARSLGPEPVDHIEEPTHESGQPLTVPQVAELLGFARGYTYEPLRSGEIRALRRGRYWRVTPQSVEDFIRSKRGPHPT